MDRAAICSFMARYRYGVIASIGQDGAPQAALVGIAVTPEMEIVFDANKNSRKYRNLMALPRCSFAIGWPGEQTVQVQGRAHEPVGAELDHYREAYFKVWPEGRARLSWPNLAHLVVRPNWVRFSDYDQSPALIEEMEITDDSRPG